MLKVFAETEIKAEKRVGQRAYLARIVGSQREFAPVLFKEKNRRGFALASKAGDVFEARRYWWNGEKDTGGTVWFTVDGAGFVHPLTREEAMEIARGAAQIAFQSDRVLPAKMPTPVGRMPIERVACRVEQAEPVVLEHGD